MLSLFAFAALLPALKPATGFTVVRDHGLAWLVNPAGKRTWSFGVCVVDTGVKFDEYDTANPAYSAWRYYTSKPAWATDALKILKSGGFNTVGAWSDYSSLLASPGNDLMMTPILHSGSSAGFPWLDMWDPKLVKVADDVTKGLITGLKNDPRIIGYFSDNELGWWKPAIWDWVWKQKSHYERAHVVATLRSHYRGSWQGFTAEFQVDGASGWEALAKRGHPYLRPDCRGIDAITEVLGMLADRYYTLCGGLIKKYAPHALYLGDRYISNYYPEIAAAAGRHCDVVSTNLNPDFTDGAFADYYLASLERLTGKPLMITEYYMCAREGRSGNGNDRSGFPVVQTLAERAAGFETTTRALLGNPNVVGAHWFQYYDEPKNGRGDGENYNFGVVDTSNRPYTELLERGRALDLNALHAAAVKGGAVSGVIPPAPADGAELVKWDRVGGLIRAQSRVPRGDLYAAWSTGGLELGLIWPDERFGAQYFKGNKEPRASWTTIEVSCGATGKSCVIALDQAGHGVATPNWAVKGKNETTSRVVVTVPAQALGFAALSAGEPIDLTVKLVCGHRAYTTVWHVRSTLGAPPMCATGFSQCASGAPTRPCVPLASASAHQERRALPAPTVFRRRATGQRPVSGAPGVTGAYG
ncbi:MAG TPA: hypothetical protein VKT78_04970 [Fimbriimonadaceae bacterium]|nr:hypothetical protein [Fimbriimonadaceae bacterium]